MLYLSLLEIALRRTGDANEINIQNGSVLVLRPPENCFVSAVLRLIFYYVIFCIKTSFMTILCKSQPIPISFCLHFGAHQTLQHGQTQLKKNFCL